MNQTMCPGSQRSNSLCVNDQTMMVQTDPQVLVIVTFIATYESMKQTKMLITSSSFSGRKKWNKFLINMSLFNKSGVECMTLVSLLGALIEPFPLSRGVWGFPVLEIQSTLTKSGLDFNNECQVCRSLTNLENLTSTNYTLWPCIVCCLKPYLLFCLKPYFLYTIFLF